MTDARSTVTDAPPDVSVIIPTFEREDELEQTLASLTEQTTSMRFEIVVADDGSAGDTVAVVRGFESRLDLVYTRQKDTGFRLSAARNLGARASRGRTLIFLDCGTLAGPSLVESHGRRVEAGRRATTGPTFGWDLSGADAVRFREIVRGSGWQERHEQMSDHPLHRDYRSEKWLDVFERRVPLALPWRFFWGRNIGVARSDYDAAGGFDERFASYGVEDVEFGYRLQRRGVELGWSEDAWAVELPSISEDAAAQAEQNRANLARWADRCTDLQIEFFVCNRPLPQLEQPEWERIERWSASATNSRDDLDVLVRASRTSDSMLFVGSMVGAPHSRSVVTLGPGFPIGTLSWADCLERSTQEPVDVNAIGIRAGFADRSFDTVYISDAMAPLAATWGEHLLRTARRCGRGVQLGRAFSAALSESGVV
ncbi:glycosyltransferase [Rathayibacter sp. VKM Ac-2803]|uniref:glycosyltransferase n=1 Tax=Rathayibacter sp. VKM Ac-2803 TaxID=2609256 RepID=UPI0013595728|nr:glycosyltransferase [Rathayibacter sp. VKM Ac-2803]MWV50708.1 glycosyltransferase [Rathayibacter sp. VKM Ac-2803]